MKNCLVVTGNPGNPPSYKWIKDLLPILHKDKRLKKLVPDISVVIKQPQNVGSFAIRAKHWKVPTSGDDTTQPGCFRLHQPHSCVCCSMMEEHSKSFTSTKTERKYTINRRYNCLSSWVLYVVTCQTCRIQYVGQTTQEMRKRHYGHRSDVRSGTAGLGSHFHEKHGVNLDLQIKEDLKTCMEGFSLVIVASVKPPATPEEAPACQARLHRLRCMSENGGMSNRDETKKGGGS